MHQGSKKTILRTPIFISLVFPCCQRIRVALFAKFSSLFSKIFLPFSTSSSVLLCHYRQLLHENHGQLLDQEDVTSSPSIPPVQPSSFLLLIPIEELGSGKVAVLVRPTECGWCYWGKKTIQGSNSALRARLCYHSIGARNPSWSASETPPPCCHPIHTSPDPASKTTPAGDLDRGRYRCANIMPGKHGFLRLRFAINSLLSRGPRTWDLEEFTTGGKMEAGVVERWVVQLFLSSSRHFGSTRK